MTIQNDFFIKNELWYKIGGTVKYFITCHNSQDIKEALEFVRKNNTEKVFVLGLGSNLIFTDEYYDGAVIQIISNSVSNDLQIADDRLIDVFAGVEFDDLIKFVFEHNLVGLEWAGGLPGTVGAGVRGNVGAFGGEIKDSIEKVEVFDYSNGKAVLRVLTNKDLDFVYRGSLVKAHKKMVVARAFFKLRKGNAKEVEKARVEYEKNIQFRKDRHPLEYPNCGSVFKNIRDKDKIEKVLSTFPDLKELVEKKWYGKIAVASVIEKFGLKGYRVGDAQVSEKHALFIVNLGHATNHDVQQVIDTVQKKFQQAFGFNLEVEVEIVN